MPDEPLTAVSRTDPLFPEYRRGGGALVDAELGVDVVEVLLYGPERDPKALSDLRVCAASMPSMSAAVGCVNTPFGVSFWSRACTRAWRCGAAAPLCRRGGELRRGPPLRRRVPHAARTARAGRLGWLRRLLRVL